MPSCLSWLTVNDSSSSYSFTEIVNLGYLFFATAKIYYILQTKIVPEFVLFFDCSEEDMERRLLNRNQVGQGIFFVFEISTYHPSF